jgi:hypothetical protein
VNLACVGIVGPELAATSKDPFKCCHLPSDFDHVTVVSYGLQAVIVTLWMNIAMSIILLILYGMPKSV